MSAPARTVSRVDVTQAPSPGRLERYRIQVTLARDAGLAGGPLEDYAFALVAAAAMGAGNLAVTCTRREVVLTMTLSARSEAAAMAAAASAALALAGQARVPWPAL